MNGSLNKYIEYEQLQVHKSLNREQSNVFNELIKFVNLLILNKEHSLSSNQLNFLLNGPGGSGKTYIISKLISLLKGTGVNYKILAPTHKACNVLKLSMANEEVFTLAKFLGYRESVDDNGVKIVTYEWFEKSSKNKEDLLIIDECSMISKEQVEVLQKTKINVIYIGDFCQINPVGEELSDVFGLDFYCTGTLIKNERITNQSLADIIIDYRESVIKGFIQKKCLVNCHKIGSRVTFDKLLIDSFLNKEDTIYIAYSNVQVKKYNETIRTALFPDIKDDYTIGERLCFSTFYWNQSKFYSGQKVTVSKCYKETKYILNPHCICNGKETPFMVDICIPLKIEKCMKCHTPTSLVNFKKFEFWHLEFKGHQENVFYKPVEGMKDIYSVLYKYRDRAKFCKKKELWADYYNMENVLNVPVEYSYCITVHKSQGSGYANVFVDLENIFWCQNEKEKLKLAYTAISRAQQSVSFFK